MNAFNYSLPELPALEMWVSNISSLSTNEQVVKSQSAAKLQSGHRRGLLTFSSFQKCTTMNTKQDFLKNRM